MELAINVTFIPGYFSFCVSCKFFGFFPMCPKFLFHHILFIVIAPSVLWALITYSKEMLCAFFGTCSVFDFNSVLLALLVSYMTASKMLVLGFICDNCTLCPCYTTLLTPWCCVLCNISSWRWGTSQNLSFWKSHLIKIRTEPEFHRGHRAVK